ncbi:MAG: putative peptidoglycan lipid II flippase [Cellvibrionaceae bacterium]|jgi:putative peptidoglycan lipid II flippase
MTNDKDSDDHSEIPESSIEPHFEPTPLSQNRKLLSAVSMLAVANVIQRLLGLGREAVKVAFFGATGTLDAFNLAAEMPQTFYQLIAGGEMINSSLVPIFSEYAAKKQRDELWSAVSICLSLVTVIMVVFVIVVETFTPVVAQLIGAGELTDPSLFQLTVDLMRMTAPVMLFLSVSSIITAALNSLERFTLPAFTISLYNGSIILSAVLFPNAVGALAWGMLIGSILMIALQVPGLHDAKLRFHLEWRHPIVRRIMRLYAPILLGLFVNQFSLLFGYRLAAGTGNGSVTLMRTSTTLYQLPIGLVVVALSTAILPTLSQQANRPLAEFKRTLAEGLRLVIALVFPAAAGLFVLAPAIITLLFQRGEFLAADTALAAQILRIDLFGLPFAGIDLMLIYASYARKDTLRPALVGVASVIFYVIAASILTERLGLPGLMAANAGKIIVHTILMFILLQRNLDGLRGFGISGVFVRSLFAALIMGLISWVLWFYLDSWLQQGNFIARLVPVLIPGGAGLFIYLLMANLLGIEEAQHLTRLLPFMSKSN